MFIMHSTKKCFLVFLLMLSSCTAKTMVDLVPFEALINLEDATRLIRVLLAQNKLSEILEEHDPKQLEVLINNFSPAQIAFEAEVPSTIVPCVVVYYFKDSSQEQEFIKQLDQLALEHDDKVKFVIVNADTLFSLAQDADIEKYPTILVFKGRTVVDRIEYDITLDLLKQRLNHYLE